MASRVLVLEFNELTPSLIDRFIDEGALPNFARMRNESTCWTTDAEEPQELLNPWIQWVTVHTGVGYGDHGVLKLGAGAANRFATVADVVGDAGGAVWLCGPMNVAPVAPVRGRHLPDPWSTDVPTEPRSLEAFGDFVRANVQEHSNASARLSPRSTARFVAFLVRHGLRPRTVRATVSQLAGERRHRAGRWRRAVILDRFQWDVFRAFWKRDRPRFATFFSNSTAHFQHVYWRHMEPERFMLRPSDQELAAYRDSIREGYRGMDVLLGEALDLVDADTHLVLCTALSQQPYLQMEAEGGKRFHRPYDLGAVLDRLEVGGVVSVAPVMAEQFHVFFADDVAAEAAEARLSLVRVDGEPALMLRRSGSDLFVGCSLFGAVPEDARLIGPDGDVGLFSDLFYRSELAKSGMHHPDGLLWIRSPNARHHTDAGRASLRSVAPTLLALLDLHPPPTMQAPSLLPSAGR